MSLDPLRLIEHIHGHLGWLSAAALVHPAIVLRDRARRANLAVGLATTFVTVASGIGVWLYVSYREKLRQGIFLHAPAIGLLFERKEHLAFGAVVLAWAGASAYVAASRATPEVRGSLRTIAHRSFVAAVLGTVVAVYRSF
jgi:hypothetical protein